MVYLRDLSGNGQAALSAIRQAADEATNQGRDLSHLLQ
jgi:hypothetical protein